MSIFYRTGGGIIRRKLILTILLFSLIAIVSLNGIYAVVDNGSENITDTTNVEMQTASNNNELTSTGNSYSVAQIEDAATRVRNFIQVNRVLPNFVTINKNQVSMPDFLHILSTTTINLGQSKNTPLTQYTVTPPTHSPEQINSGNIQKAEYLQLAQTIKNHIETTTKAPPSITSSRGTISYESTIYMYSRIIAFHGTQKTLPNFAAINNWNGQKLPQNPPTQPNPTPEPQPPAQPNPTPEPQPPVQGQLTSTGNSYTVAQIEDAALRVRNFIQNNRVLPNFVTINRKQVSMPDFLHILTTATLNLNQRINSPLTQYTVTAPTYSPEQINSGNILRAEYLQLAQTIKNHIETTTKAPPSITSSRGTISYESAIFMFSRIIAFHGTQKTLPNFAAINNWNGQKLPNNPPVTQPEPEVPTPDPEPEQPTPDKIIKTSYSYSVTQIENAAIWVRNFIQNNNKLPEFVTINNRQVKMSDFLHILLQSTINLNQKITTAVTQYHVPEPTHSTQQVNAGNIYSLEYIFLAKNMLKYMETNNQAPFAIQSTRGTLSYESIIYMYSRIIAFHGTQKTLPNFAAINNWNGQKLPNSPVGAAPMSLFESHTSPPHLNGAYNVEITPEVVKVTAKCTCGISGYTYSTSSFVNYCVRCKNHGTLLWNPKGVVDGEWSCGRCGADYCGASGKEKMPNSNYYLISA
ncbi:hypothetical protein JCM15415_16470 [Methanobacterium movens]